MSHFSIAANTENPAETIVQIQELGLYVKHVAAPFFLNHLRRRPPAFFFLFLEKEKPLYHL